MQVTSHKERERELRQVLDKRQFEVWYQPIYRLEDGKLEGFESLLRWRRVDGSIDSFRDLLAWPRIPDFPSRWAARRWTPCAGSCGPGATARRRKT